MATIYEIIFTLQFILYLGVILYKTYNLMHRGDKCDIPTIWVTFILAILCYASGFVVALLGYSELLFVQLFRLQSWTLPVLFMLLAGEVLTTFKILLPGNRQSYNAMRANR